MSSATSGRVKAIFLCSDKGLPMQKVGQARAVQGRGLAGDRYASNKGAWSQARPTIRHVSLIASEAIKEGNSFIDVPFSWAETRRNVVTEGVDLNALVGQEFMIGVVHMRGIELCTPCDRPSKLSGKKGFAHAFGGRGGIRAEILTNGIIFVLDPILIP
jgi:MOSC domain-containing protein YiiM